MNYGTLRFPIVCRHLIRYVRNSNRRFSTSLQNLVRHKSLSTRRETDFLQPTGKISTPSAVCVLKNYFVSFNFVEQSDVGRAVQIIEYHLNGDIKARLLLTMAEFDVLFELINSAHAVIVEGQGTFSPVEKSVEQITMRIWEGMECGLRVLQISQSTPMYGNLRPLVIPVYNLKEFLNQVDTVLMGEKSNSV